MPARGQTPRDNELSWDVAGPNAGSRPPIVPNRPFRNRPVPAEERPGAKALKAAIPFRHFHDVSEEPAFVRRPPIDAH